MIWIFFVFMFIFSNAYADEQSVEVLPEHDFVSASKCSVCHKSEKSGKQYQIWQESKHAHAYQTLLTKEAKETAARFNIQEPEKSGKCLRCHSTAYWFSEEKKFESVSVEEGVSCETCHGPGKDYMKLSVMKDRAASVKAGLILPTEETCRKCHNETAPNVKEFDYSKSWEKIKHPKPVTK